MAATVDPKRIGAIADVLRMECNAIRGNLDRLNELKDERLGIDGDATNAGEINTSRLAIARRIAGLSSANAWTDSEIKAAIERAKKMSNDNPDDNRSDKSLGVFISEMNRVASPKVRDVFNTLADACETAWSEEARLLNDAENKREVDAPVHKYKSRIWHLTIDIARRVHKGELVVHGPYDVITWCKDHDPDEDAAKIAKKIEVMIETLQGFYSEFAHAGIYDAMEHLGGIDEDSLKAVRKRDQGAQAPAITRPLPKPPQKAPQAVASVSAAPIPANDETASAGSVAGSVTPAEGVFDPLAAFENLSGDKPVHLVTSLAA